MEDIYYLMTDQPTTCPICGARTDLAGNFSHTLQKVTVQQCLNGDCGVYFWRWTNNKRRSTTLDKGRIDFGYKSL